MASVEVPLARATPEREEEGHPPLLRSVSSFNAGFRFTAGSPQKQEKGREIGALGTAILAGSEEENVDSPYDRKVVHLEEELDGEEGEGGGHVGEKLVDSSSASRLSPAGWPSQVEMRWADTNSFPARKKHQCWCQLPNGEWGLGQILSKSGEECIISVLEGKVLKVNSENLLPANPEILNGVDDLMQLSYLNEPSVLYNIEYRYSQNMIYTKAGPVLVAINPFKNVNLYGSSYIEAYRCRSMDGPHVYAIAGTAMQEMIRGSNKEISDYYQCPEVILQKNYFFIHELLSSTVSDIFFSHILQMKLTSQLL